MPRKRRRRLLDPETTGWIEAALAATPHGEIILIVQDHQVMRVDIRGSRRVLKPIDKCAERGR